MMFKDDDCGAIGATGTGGDGERHLKGSSGKITSCFTIVCSSVFIIPIGGVGKHGEEMRGGGSGATCCCCGEGLRLHLIIDVV